MNIIYNENIMVKGKDNIKNIQKDIQNIIKRIENLEIIIKTNKDKKRHKDPNLPKNIQNAYLFFKNEKIKEFKKNNPDKKVKVTEIAKNIVPEWNNIKSDKKLFDKYKKLQEKDKKRYKKEMDIYNKNKLSK